MVYNHGPQRSSTRNSRNLVFVHESILEIHFVREHALADGERRGQILAEQLLFGVLLNGADQLPVDLNLVFLALFGDDVGGLLLLEDFAFAVTDLLDLERRKYSSFTVSGTLTPEMSIFVL